MSSVSNIVAADLEISNVGSTTVVVVSFVGTPFIVAIFLIVVPAIVPISSLEVMASGNGGTALINARRGYVFAGTYDAELNVIYPDSYILMSDNLKKPYISYDKFDFAVEKPIVDVLKVIRKHENNKSVNPHSLKPNYLKLTEAEEKFNHDRES